LVGKLLNALQLLLKLFAGVSLLLQLLGQLAYDHGGRGAAAGGALAEATI